MRPERAVEILKDRLAVAMDYTRWVGGSYYEALRTAIRALKRETGWIPVSKRLPELDEDGYSDKVLVCFTNFSGCEICEYRECDDCHGWYIGDSDDNPEDVGVHVIAWMPLPEPYEEDQDDDRS